MIILKIKSSETIIWNKLDDSWRNYHIYCFNLRLRTHPKLLYCGVLNIYIFIETKVKRWLEYIKGPCIWAPIWSRKFFWCLDVGISSFQTEPEQAGAMIRKCVEQVALKNLPHKDVKKTAVYVGATAGMRLLWYIIIYVVMCYVFRLY